MAKKMTKAESKAFGTLGVFGLGLLAVVWVFQKTIEIFKVYYPFILAVLAISIAYFVYVSVLKKRKRDFEQSISNLFKVHENEIMSAFHSTYFKNKSGSYSQEVRSQWREKVIDFLEKTGLPEDVPDTPKTRQDAASHIHELALRHENRGELKTNFSYIDSHEALLSAVATELDNNGWKPSKVTGRNIDKIDLKAEKNGHLLFVQCVYDIGKIGVGKIKGKILATRSDVNDQVAVLALHGFTNQAEKLCKDSGVMSITPEQIPFIDNKMGI